MLIVAVSGLFVPTTEPSVEVPQVTAVGKFTPQPAMKPCCDGVSVMTLFFAGRPLAERSVPDSVT